MTAVKPMLAHSKTPDLSTLTYPQVIQPKFDGIRALIVDGVVQSRSGKQIPNAEIQAALGRPEFNGLDGELLVGPPTANDAMQRTTEFVMSRSKTGADWKFYLFDKYDHSGGYTERIVAAHWNLDLLLGSIAWQSMLGRFERVESVYVNSPADVEEHEARFVAQGYEGAILRDPRAPYKHGRSGKTGPLLKVKRFIDFEARVVGVYERQINGNAAKQDAFGRTERSTAKDGLIPAGDLGGFELVALNGPHEGQTFRCGTGFDAAQRVALWNEHRRAVTGSFIERNDLALVGRIVKVKSFPVGVKDAPRFPVWLGFRHEDDLS